MRKSKKVLALVLALVLTVSGLYIAAPSELEAQAASSTQASEVSDGMLNVKMQVSKPDGEGRVNLRILSSVSGLDYKNAGFEVWYGDDAKNPTKDNMVTRFKTTTVYKNITAGVSYKYSPKIIDTSSEYFITGTIKGINPNKLGENFYIKAFCTTMDGEVVYGVGRFFNVEDAASKQIINIPIAMSARPETNADGTLKAAVKLGTQTTTATLESYSDGYAHLNVSVSDKTALKSATKIEIGGASTIYRNFETSYAGTGDTSWYDVYVASNPAETEFVIITPADLYGFASLAASNNFAGKTVYAVSNIEANKGTQYSWTPISPSSKPFAGTFDGQGHTISGIYQPNVISSYAGLFGSTAAGSTIKNLRLTESTFTHTGTGDSGRMGSIVGLANGGTFQNIYSSANLTSGGYGTAGIIGVMVGNVTVSNCWYDGELKSTTNQNYCRAGGIVGWADSGTLYVEHCLNTGSIYAAASDKQSQVGGLVGVILENVTKAVIRDSLNTGSVDVAKGTSSISSLVGLNKSNGTVAISGSYATIESCVKLQNYPNDYMIQTWSGKTTNKEQMVMLSEGTEGYASMKGVDGYKNTLLNFESYWSAVDGDTPILTSFVTDETVLDVSKVERKVDDKAMTSWYKYGASGTAEDPYVIETAADLYGLYSLVGGNNSFAGKHIVLANDIVVNASDRDTWEANAPINQWYSIGSYNARPFSGHFDGQGYTISGLYSRRLETENYTNHVSLFAYTKGDCVIENVSLKNSSFTYEGTDDFGRTSSFVMWAEGNTILRNLYSDAKLKSSYEMIGGIACITNGNTKISNCWFDGSIQCSKDTTNLRLGGIVGWGSGTKMIIEHCLNTGTVHGNASSGQATIGGLVGHIDTNTVTEVKDCLNTGRVTSNGTIMAVSTLIGRTKSTNLILHKSYSTKESCGMPSLDAYTTNDPLYQSVDNKPKYDGISDGNVARKLENDLKGINGYKNTLLDFKDYWTAVEGGTPILTTFVTDENVINVENIDRPVGYDKAWASQAAGTASDPYVFDDAADFAYFIALANQGSTPRYKGVYFALGDDIIWNASNRDTWGTTAPLNAWSPIGSSSIQFAGNFDGRGHSISGLYQTVAKSGYYGLFSHSAAGCVIENLSITNSMFVGTTTGDKSRMGSFVAWSSAGTFRNLYSDVKMTNSDMLMGGIIGVTIGATDVSNCWYDGEIYSTTNGDNLRAAGIVGWINNGPVTVKHCLNTGTIKSNATSGKAPQQGGLIGYAEAGTITVEDCLNTGVVSTAGATSQVSTLIGRNKSGTVTTIKNTYATIESCGIAGLKTQPTYYLYQTDAALTSENVAMVSVAGAEGFLPINGYSAYLNTNLMFDDAETDAAFDGYWVAIEGKTPVLKSFANEDVIDLTTMVPDTSWYTADKSEYTLQTAEELYGLSTLAQTQTFANVTIKLGNDIKCNNGEADNWSASAPDYSWMPIGTSTTKFAGHFDGQGNTISGVYYSRAKDTTGYAGLFRYLGNGSVVENFNLKNSYFTSGGFGQDNARMGSIASWVEGGTLRNIYSEAKIYAQTSHIGGIACLTTGNKSATIANCWFDGDITVANTSYTAACAGILGWANSTVLMTACLNTGEIDATGATYSNATNGHEVGGLLGMANAGTPIIDNCLHAGKIIEPATPKNVSALVGFVRSGSVAIKNTYAVAEDNPATASNGAVTWEPQGYGPLVSKEDLKGDLAQANTSLDFESYWVIQDDSTPILQALADARDVYIQNPESMAVAWASEFEVPADMVDYSKKKQI